jgi:hypothetical protein
MIETAHSRRERETSCVRVDDVQGRELRDRTIDAVRLDAKLGVEPRQGPRAVLAKELRNDPALCIRVDSLPPHAKPIPLCVGMLGG